MNNTRISIITLVLALVLNVSASLDAMKQPRNPKSRAANQEQEKSSKKRFEVCISSAVPEIEARKNYQVLLNKDL